MKNIIQRIGNLITVKTIVTLILTVIFGIITMRGIVPVELFVTVYGVIIGYYFGTQKIDDTASKNNKNDRNSGIY